MAKKIYFSLLLLCGILCQGILAHENIKKPSDTLIREKRVINRIPGEDKKTSVFSARYIVRIKEQMRFKCVGSILSKYVVITIPECVVLDAQWYQIASGSSSTDYGTMHAVSDIKKHFGNHPRRPQDGVALLIVLPAFQFGRTTASIELHSASLLPDTIGTVYGWGFNFRGESRGTQHPRNLRSIEVPIISHRQCVDIYRSINIEISDKDICTFHTHKQCGHTDGGSPLVVNGYLAGIRLLTNPTAGMVDCRFPDVFVIVQHIEYIGWITSNLHNIEAYFHNHRSTLSP